MVRAQAAVAAAWLAWNSESSDDEWIDSESSKATFRPCLVPKTTNNFQDFLSR